jgi:hypothetical protein
VLPRDASTRKSTRHQCRACEQQKGHECPCVELGKKPHEWGWKLVLGISRTRRKRRAYYRWRGGGP